MSLTGECSPRLLDRLCLDAITYALNAPTLTIVQDIEDYTAYRLLDQAERFGAVAAVTIARASASASRMRKQELLDLAIISKLTTLPRCPQVGEVSA